MASLSSAGIGNAVMSYTSPLLRYSGHDDSYFSGGATPRTAPMFAHGGPIAKNAILSGRRARTESGSVSIAPEHGAVATYVPIGGTVPYTASVREGLCICA